MYMILFKFYDKYWKPYFDSKTYNKEEARELYNHLIHSYPDSQ